MWSLMTIQEAPEFIKVALVSNDKYWAHPVMSGMVGAIIGSILTIFGTIIIQRNLINQERKIRFKDEQMKVFSEYLKFNPQSYKVADENGTDDVYYASLAKKIYEDVMYLPPTFQKEVIEYDKEIQEQIEYSFICSEKTRFVLDGILKGIQEEYKNLQKELNT